MRPCYIEIPAADLVEARRFYGEILGWQIEESPLEGPTYLMFQTGEGSLAGGFVTGRPPAPDAGPLLYLAVDDIEASLSKIEQGGGLTMMGRTGIGGDMGSIATFRDPLGNLLGLWSEA